MTSDGGLKGCPDTMPVKYDMKEMKTLKILSMSWREGLT